MSDDPHPELRCRCIARRTYGDFDLWPSAYVDRCRNKATQEDGFCDHCRTPHEPGESATCNVFVCCFSDDNIRTTVTNPATACLDYAEQIGGVKDELA